MSRRTAGRGEGPEGDGTPAAGGKRPGPELNSSSGYTYLSYLIGGMVIYGGVGWLIGRWTHLPVLFPIGMLAGLALAVALIIFRVTRSGPQGPHGS
jgi:ATP synthase protein I